MVFANKENLLKSLDLNSTLLGSLNYVPQNTCIGCKKLVKSLFCLRIPFAIVTAMSDRVFSTVYQIAENNFLNHLRHEKLCEVQISVKFRGLSFFFKFQFVFFLWAMK